MRIARPQDVHYPALEGGGRKEVTHLGAIRASEQMGILPDLQANFWLRFFFPSSHAESCPTRLSVKLAVQNQNKSCIRR